MMRYFISGAQGFVGRYLVAHILTSTRQARIFGAGRSPRQDHSFTHRVRWAARTIAAPLPAALKVFANRRYKYVSMDLVNEREVASALQAFRPDVVIHLASGLRDDAPSLLFKTNVEGTIALMEAIAIAEIPLRKIVLGSTAGVYGVPQTVPIDEEAACNPIDIYSLSKLAAEQVSRILMRRRRLPVVYARLFNLAGPGQDERHICGSFSSRAAAIASAVAAPVMQVQSLSTTRDFIDIRDTARALFILAQDGQAGFTYNVASGREVSMATVLEQTLLASGLSNRVLIEKAPERPVDIPRHFASIERLQKLGFSPGYSLVETIRDLVVYYQETVKAAAETAISDTVLVP